MGYKPVFGILAEHLSHLSSTRKTTETSCHPEIDYDESFFTVIGKCNGSNKTFLLIPALFSRSTSDQRALEILHVSVQAHCHRLQLTTKVWNLHFELDIRRRLPSFWTLSPILSISPIATANQCEGSNERQPP